MTKELLLLAVISKAKERGLSPVQLQKAVFLLQQAFEKEISNKYHFMPYNYGPFDKSIYIDSEKLAQENSLMISVNENWRRYKITAAGKEKIDAVDNVNDKKIISYAGKLVPWIQGLTFEQLLASIYKKYPEYKVNSIFKEKN